jgi:arginine:pyruvate transaminase
MHFPSRVSRIASKGASAWKIHHEARRRQAAGQDVILLTVGNPDLAPPSGVIDATVESLRQGRTGYAPIAGYPEVRAAIAARFARRTGQPCTADNVVAVPGAQAGLFCALQCLAEPGDEVIIGEPMYATYEAAAGAAGAAVITVPLKPETGFHFDLDALARAVTPRTRVLWINSPNNPTGAVMTRQEVEAAAELCRRHDLWLLSDEVYADFAFARPHFSPWALPGMDQRTVVVSSLSKSHAIPGFRFGWIIGPAEITKHLSNLLLCMLYGGPPFIQDGVLAALRGDLPEVAAAREAYRHRAALLTRVLAGAPDCNALLPEGGMFVLFDILRTRRSAEDFAYGLLEEENVAVMPCDGFGPGAVGYLRISLASPEASLEEAGHRIVRYARKLAEQSWQPCRSQLR